MHSSNFRTVLQEYVFEVTVCQSRYVFSAVSSYVHSYLNLKYFSRSHCAKVKLNLNKRKHLSLCVALSHVRVCSQSHDTALKRAVSVPREFKILPCKLRDSVVKITARERF